ncbi:hypothetical protein F3J29_05800 [Enterobacter sp. Cy-643]|uniref:hypothetical protein n=1 Tax=Enterobacter sp. Cy-643 TaxID=2608346 RepID=UPI001420891F|nr:hypothetical protein [Enterobacter sp. Cy-643]NIF31648.1 hypothetical protein [Enterobacter sp. Cy-643]
MNIQIIVNHVSEGQSNFVTYYGNLETFTQIQVGDHWRLDDRGGATLWTVSERTIDIVTHPTTGNIEFSQLRFTLTA